MSIGLEVTGAAAEDGKTVQVEFECELKSVTDVQEGQEIPHELLVRMEEGDRDRYGIDCGIV